MSTTSTKSQRHGVHIADNHIMVFEVDVGDKSHPPTQTNNQYAQFPEPELVWKFFCRDHRPLPMLHRHLCRILIPQYMFY